MENNTNDVWMVRVFDVVIIKVIENNINTHGKHEYFYGFYGFWFDWVLIFNQHVLGSD